MSEAKHSRTEFGAWWNELNREYPPFKLPADVLAAQAERWYRELNEFTIFALNDALSHWLRTQDRRPKLAHMMAGCLQYLMRINAVLEIRAKKEITPADSDHCPCHCGGARWASVLFDAAGKPRTEKIGEFDATRDHVACLAKGVDIIPTERADLLGRDSRGVPIWIVRETAREAAA